MEDRKIRVALTHGDTNGVGYELIFKAFADPAMLELCTPIIYGSPKVAAYHCKALGLEGNTFTIIHSADEALDGHLNLLPVFDEEVKVELGQPSQDASRAAVKSLDRAITDYKDGLYDVLIAGPVDKDNMSVDGYDFPTSARFIESSIGDNQNGIDLLVGGDMRLALVTGDVALADVSPLITKEAIVKKAAQLYATLRRDFAIDCPRIAILALNPDDSESHPGKEETAAIIPAVQQLADAGMCAFGPYRADEFFANADYTSFDAILAMYHDQGVVPFRTLHPDGAYHYLGGLPLIAASADMGPCYEQAGKGTVDAQSLRNAIYQAIDGYRARITFDEPYANPLPKLYHEKRDDNDKVRFSIPKKHENSIKERL